MRTLDTFNILAPWFQLARNSFIVFPSIRYTTAVQTVLTSFLHSTTFSHSPDVWAGQDYQESVLHLKVFFCCCFHSPFPNLLFCPFSNLLFHFKIKSIEVNLHATKHTPLYVYSLMSFDRCIYPGNYHPKEDIEFFHNVEKVALITIHS